MSAARATTSTWMPLTEECVMAKLKDIHPGEILLEEFLIPWGSAKMR